MGLVTINSTFFNGFAIHFLPLLLFSFFPSCRGTSWNCRTPHQIFDSLYNFSSSKILNFQDFYVWNFLICFLILYFQPSSTLKLMCRIVQNTEASAFIFWYHDNRMINYDSDRGINVSTEAGTWYFHLISSLITKHHRASVFVKFNPCWVSVDKRWINTTFSATW